MLPVVRYVAVIPRGHRLAKRAAIHAKDFHGEPFIALGEATRSRLRMDDVFAKHSVVPAVRVKTPLSEIACALVAAGVGCSVVDPFTAAEFISRDVVVKRFEPATEFQVAALYSRRRPPAPAATDFVDGFARYLERYERI